MDLEKIKSNFLNFINNNVVLVTDIYNDVNDKILHHPLNDTIKSFTDDEKIISLIRFAYSNEIVSKICFDIQDKTINKEDIPSITSKYISWIDEMNKELSTKSEDDVYITYEDYKDIDKELLETSFYIIKIIVQYFNFFGLSKTLRETKDDILDLKDKILVVIVWYLHDVLKNGDDLNESNIKSDYIGDIIHNRYAIKKVSNNLKEDASC